MSEWKTYNPTWSTFVGHKKEIETLLSSKRAADARGEPLRPILLWGPSGCGKTTLARLVGGNNVREVNGAGIERFSLAKSVFKMRSGGTLLIDEVHAIGKKEQELLYPLMDRGEFYWGGKRIDARVTVIGTTTKIASLTPPLRNRFSITIYLSAYTQEEVTLIIQNASKELGAECTDEAAMLMAKLSRGIPRTAIALLNMARDLSDRIDEDAARRAATSLGYDEDGLTFSERLYIISLYTLDSTASLSVMSTILQQDSSSLRIIEGYLLQRGYINISSRGRELTLEGMEYAERALKER